MTSLDNVTEALKKLTINKGTGAGGSKCNKNGLSFEKMIDLETEYEVIVEKRYYKKIKFKNCSKVFKLAKKRHLFNCMENEHNKAIEKAQGCINPDECYIDFIDKKIFILEKKFQEVSGSASEKTQTPHFKTWQYSRTFPAYKIIYIYCLNNWLKLNCKAVLEYCEEYNYPVFCGEDKNYKKEIIEFITSYSL